MTLGLDEGRGLACGWLRLMATGIASLGETRAQVLTCLFYSLVILTWYYYSIRLAYTLIVAIKHCLPIILMFTTFAGLFYELALALNYSN